MHAVVKFCLLLGLILPAHFLSANSLKTIKAAIPSSMPPYIIEATQSGIVLDIINSIYAKNGYVVNFSFLPNHRAAKEFMDKRHALAFGIPNDGLYNSTFLSESILSFKNVAISLASNNFTITSASDLQEMRITAFQNATSFLGEKFEDMALDNLHYEEVTDQRQQLTLLVKGRTDLIIMEQRIFLYHAKKLGLTDVDMQQFRIHPIFKAANRYCVFHDVKQRDMFNRGLKKIKQSSEYKEIFGKYINLLKSSV